MTRDEFRRLYEYNDWANDRLTAMLTQIFGEETDLRATEEPRVRALQETTVHIIAAQAIWRSRWEGMSPTSRLDPAEYPTPLSLRMAFGAERARFWRFFDQIESDATLALPISYTTMDGKPYADSLQEMMQHVINHSTYHRGQVTARLLDLGHNEAVVWTDLIVFLRD